MVLSKEVITFLNELKTAVTIADASDPNLGFIFVNEYFTVLTGYKKSEALGKNGRFLQGKETDIETKRKVRNALYLKKSIHVEILNYKKDGSPFWNEMKIDPIFNKHGECILFVGLQLDITERKDAEKRIFNLAYIDQITGLPNRNKLFLDLNKIIRQDTNNNIGFFYLDLDHFKNVNDSLGHTAGDRLLSQVSKRLLILTEKCNLKLYRLGGDEFIFLLPGFNSINLVAEKILDCFKKPFLINNKNLFIKPSVGISLFPHHGTESETLLKLSETAMYHAKKQGGCQFCLYHQELFDIKNRRIELENSLRSGLYNNQFYLYYQPKINFSKNKLIGFEALVRWEHPSLGSISPNEFIPLAEETGTIIPLGYWIFKQACKQLNTWLEFGFKDVTLSINISAVQIRDKGFVHFIISSLEKYNIRPRNLILEITEGVDLNEKTAVSFLTPLRELGIKIALDDFGKGYSTFAFLTKMPFDIIKMDKSLIENICLNESDSFIAKAIIEIGNNLNKKIIAEGIETEEQVTLLSNYGCELGQGFLFSKPISATTATKLLAGDLSL